MERGAEGTVRWGVPDSCHRGSTRQAQGMRTVIETLTTIRWAHLTIGTSSAGISPPELALI